MNIFLFFFFVIVTPSVLYTVQRVITTSQIQSTEMLECGNNPGTNLHIATATNSTCSNTYQTQAHMISQQLNETQQNPNYYATPTTNSVANNPVSINRPLHNVMNLETIHIFLNHTHTHTK